MRVAYYILMNCDSRDGVSFSKERGTCVEVATARRPARAQLCARDASRRLDAMSFDFFNQNQAPPGGGGPALGPNGEESACATAPSPPRSSSRPKKRVEGAQIEA